MEILIRAAQLILSLSILVIFHEFGHFFFAKLFKARVEKFYLFFNPWFSLFKTKKGETEYGIGWLPLGGYVKISGMIDESMDKEQMDKPAEPHEFRAKPAWQRLLIMVGGVLVNFILAFVIYISVLFYWGEEYLPAENAKYGVMCDSLALEAGLQNGDKILSIDNKKIDNFRSIVPDIILEEAKTIQIERQGKKIDIKLPETFAKEVIKGNQFVDVRMPFVIADFSENSAAKEAGFEINDKVIRWNEKEAKFYDQVKDFLVKDKNKEVSVVINRKGQEKTIKFKVPESGKMEVFLDTRYDSFFKMKKIEYDFVEAIPAGMEKGYNQVGNYLKQFKLLFSSKTEGYKHVGGFIAIGKIFPTQWDWYAFWMMTALLSIMLGVVNILPIPALDGGHVMFLLYEIISGKKPGEKFMEYAQMAGMMLLLGLVLYANGNDIVKLFQ